MADKKAKTGAGGSGPEDGPEDEDSLWSEAVRDVTPLAGKKPRKTVPGAAAAKKPRKHILQPREEVLPKPPSRAGREVDARTSERLRKGQMAIEGTIDLHGSGRTEARAHLQQYLLRAQAQGKRCILVITGKGRMGEGILKSKVPEWLNEAPLRDIVLQSTLAKPKDGGAGALYVLLRRVRD